MKALCTGRQGDGSRGRHSNVMFVVDLINVNCQPLHNHTLQVACYHVKMRNSTMITAIKLSALHASQVYVI